MPTLTVTHEAPLELIRQHPDLAVDLVRAMTSVPVPADGRARLGPTDGNSVVPAQFTADSVVVVGPDPREADKCRRVISMGHPGWDLWPIVIDPAHAPSDQDAGPYLLLFLACLPALDMESAAGAARVLDAIRGTGASAAQRKRLATILLERASDAARRHLEELMKATEYHNDFIESYVQVGIEQGIERGAVADAADKLLRLLDGRGLQPTDAQRAQVAASTDMSQLNRWFDRAITAESAADVFTD